MAWVLDTNIFVISIYDSLYLEAFKKFVSSENEPIPSFLLDEIHNKNCELHFLLQKILNSMKRGVLIKKIDELKELRKFYSNIFDFLGRRSRGFGDNIVLMDTMEKCLDRIHDIDSWADKIKCYPSSEHDERAILEKYRDILQKLERIDGLHMADLRIIVILNHMYKGCVENVTFVTRDGGLYRNKKVLEENFPNIKICKIKRYINSG